MDWNEFKISYLFNYTRLQEGVNNDRRHSPPSLMASATLLSDISSESISSFCSFSCFISISDRKPAPLARGVELLRPDSRPGNKMRYINKSCENKNPTSFNL